MSTELSCKHGIGEVFRVTAQIQMIEKMKEQFGLKRILEFPPDPVAADFPITWRQTTSPAVKGDCLFTWRAFPHVVYDMVNCFQGDLFLLIGTNTFNLGSMYQKIFPAEKELHISRSGIVKLAEKFGLQVLHSGYYDCPPWPDIRLPFGKHIKKVDADVADSVEEWEDFPGLFFRAHHVFCLAQRKA